MSPTCTCNYRIYRSVVHEVDLELATTAPPPPPTYHKCSCMYSKIFRQHSTLNQINYILIYEVWWTRSFTTNPPPQPNQTPAHQTSKKRLHDLGGYGGCVKHNYTRLDFFRRCNIHLVKTLIKHEFRSGSKKINIYSPAHFF